MKTKSPIAAIMLELNFWIGVLAIGSIGVLGGIALTVLAFQFGASLPCGLPCA